MRWFLSQFCIVNVINQQRRRRRLPAFWNMRFYLINTHIHTLHRHIQSHTHRHEFATVNAKLFVSNLENGMHRRKTHTLLQLYMHIYLCVCVCALYGDVPIMKHAMYYNWVLSIFTLFSGQRPESFASLRIVVQSLNRAPHIMFVRV